MVEYLRSITIDLKVLEQDRYALKTNWKRHRSNSFYSDFSYESSGPELKTEVFTFQTIHLTFKNHWRIVTENLFVCVCANNNIPLSLTKNTLFILIVIQQHGFSKRRWKSFLQSRRSWRWCFSQPSKSWINGLHATTA